MTPPPLACARIRSASHAVPRLLWLLAALLLPAAALAAPEFFVLDNGVGRGSWTPEQQAGTLKDLGYDGISYNYTTPAALAAWQAAFKAKGLKIYGLYVYTYIDKPVHYDPAFKDAIRMLKGSDTVIWMTLCQTKVPGDHDAEAVKLVQEIADLARESGVRVALYGHAKFYVATADDAVRIAKKAQRPNVGVTINLCHEFLTGNGDHLNETLKNAAPYLTLVTINGLDVKNKQYILRLDQGDFDTAGWVGKLLAAGYKGPVGLQCFQVKGDVRENLEADIAAWRKIAGQLRQL
jgi:sugar phosphate isomerase/epimerase